MTPRQVIFHFPSRAWVAGKSVMEQPGVAEHVAYLLSLKEKGKVHMGGPLMDEAAGGMLVLDSSVTPQEAKTIAEADPAVKSGLIRYEIRPWLITIQL